MVHNFKEETSDSNDTPLEKHEEELIDDIVEAIKKGEREKKNKDKP